MRNISKRTDSLRGGLILASNCHKSKCNLIYDFYDVTITGTLTSTLTIKVIWFSYTQTGS